MTTLFDLIMALLIGIMLMFISGVVIRNLVLGI